RQRLLELAQEYESLHAEVASPLPCGLGPAAAGPAPPRDLPEAPAGAGGPAAREAATLVRRDLPRPRVQPLLASPSGQPTPPEVIPLSSEPSCAGDSVVPAPTIASSPVRTRHTAGSAARRTLGAVRDSTASATIDTRPLVWFVKSRYFSMLFACLIIWSIVLVGIETQVLSSASYKGSGSEQVLDALSAANYILTLLFTVEMVARIYAYRLEFFVEERLWNFFDLVILVLAIIEVALELSVLAFSGHRAGFFENGGTAKLLRLFRLTRLLRLVRTFRQLKPLRMLVHSIACAGKSVFWALMLLFMIVYSFAIVLTQAVTEHTAGGEQIEDEDLVSYFGDLFRSMLSLWMAVSGGISWNELTAPLERTDNPMWMILFLLYVVFVYFFILNVVTGVFVQNAFEGAQQDLDLTIEAQLRDKHMYADRLKLLFREMHRDPEAISTGLTAAELQNQLIKPKVQSWFKALDIDAKQTWKLFKILDADRTGRVSLEDFVHGCLQLRGPATRVDVESLKWEIRGANSRAEQTADKFAGPSMHARTPAAKNFEKEGADAAPGRRVGPWPGAAGTCGCRRPEGAAWRGSWRAPLPRPLGCLRGLSSPGRQSATQGRAHHRAGGPNGTAPWHRSDVCIFFRHAPRPREPPATAWGYVLHGARVRSKLQYFCSREVG
ncbi:unnamed protein product, partial [Prorocentrum cordatum]